MLLTLLFALAPLLQDPPKPAPPDPAKVKAAVAQLTEAFAKPDAGPRLRAIENAAPFADADVVKHIARGLADKEVAVQEAAIEALRFNEHKQALDVLQDRAKQKVAKESLRTYAKLIRAVGQHGSPSSIDLLSENPWSTPDAQVIEARILGLARIRTKAAVKALTDLMEVAGPNKIQPFMKDFRVALWSLTGADQGASRELWINWYRHNKDTLEVRALPASEPRDLAQRWKRYWAKPGESVEPEKPRRKQGEERKGPEGKGSAGEGPGDNGSGDNGSGGKGPGGKG